MELMEIRRGLMMGMASKTIGKLSKYYSQTVRYTENQDFITINNPFQSDFKFMRITADEPPVDYGAIIAAASDGELGGQYSLHWNNGADNYTYYRKIVTTGVPTNNTFVIRDDMIIFGRPGGSYFWAKDTDYTIELYA